jgi:hypothetical protein
VRIFCALTLALPLAIPVFAAGRSKQHAVAPPKTDKGTIVGTVTDATSGAPLQGALVATSNGMSTTTDDAGRYQLACNLTGDITASRVGYVAVKKPITSTLIDFALPRAQSVTVKTTDGQTIILDFASTKFGYADTFQYVSGDGMNLCTPGGAAIAPKVSDYAKIVGPAHPVTDSTCCTRGPVQAIDITLKNGQQTTAYIADSCFGIPYDILGVERSTGTAKYIHFTDVSEVDFP